MRYLFYSIAASLALLVIALLASDDECEDLTGLSFDSDLGGC